MDAVAESLTSEAVLDHEGTVMAVRASPSMALSVDMAGWLERPLIEALAAADALGRASLTGMFAGAASATYTLSLALQGREGAVRVVASLRRVGWLWIVELEPEPDLDVVTPERLAQHRLEEIGVLSSGIAHDFNNILSAILGNGELLAEVLPGLLQADQADLLAAAEDIITAAQRSRELIGQMLGYAVKARPSHGLVDLSALAAEMARLLRVSTPQSVVFDFDLAVGLPRALGDPSQLRQVVMNLIVNAAEAIGDQVGSIAVRTGARFVDRGLLDGCVGGEGLAEGDYVVAEVVDTGCGMDEATVARIFDPFFTTKTKGHGLGLAGVRAIVEAHGGALLVRTAPGMGSSFQVLLPVAGAAIDDAADSGMRSRGDLSGKTVLVIDDEKIVLRVAQRILESRRARVLCAADGHLGIELFLAESASIDCVLLDVSMPFIHGLDVFRELVMIDPAARVVLISGYSGEEIQRRAAGLGVLGFLQKPFSAADLVEAIAAAIRAAPPRSSS